MPRVCVCNPPVLVLSKVKTLNKGGNSRVGGCPLYDSPVPAAAATADGGGTNNLSVSLHGQDLNQNGTAKTERTHRLSTASKVYSTVILEVGRGWMCGWVCKNLGGMSKQGGK